MKSAQRHILIFFSTLDVVFCFVALQLWPRSWWLILTLTSLINVVLVFLLLKKRKLVTLPWIMPLVAISFFSLAQGGLRQIYFTVIFSIFYLVLLVVLEREGREQRDSLGSKLDFNAWFYLLSIVVFEFFLASFLFAIIYLLQMSIWQAVLIFFVLTLAIIHSWGKIFFAYYSINRLAVIFAIGLTEIFWAITFWPTNYLVNGLVLSLLFYVFIKATLNYARNTLHLKNELFRASLLFILIIITLFFSQWEIII